MRLIGVGLEELRQQLEEPQRRVVLALLQERPRPAATLWRSRAAAAGADRVMPALLDREDRLHPYVVAPAVDKVVLVEEPFADADPLAGGRCGAPQRPHGCSNRPSETMSFLPAISHHRRARKPDGTLGGPRKRQWEG